MADAWCDETPDGGRPWERLTPGSDLAAVVATIDPTTLPGEARVSLLKAREAVVGWATMLAAEALVATADAVVEAVGPSVMQESWVGDELAAALHVAPSTALSRLSTARNLTQHYPAVGDQVSAGRLTVSQARAIIESLTPLGVHRDDAGALLSDVVIDQILPTAASFPPVRLRDRVRAAVVAIAPDEAAQARKRTVREDTKINFFTEAETGMAYLGIRGAGVDILALRHAIRARAHAMREVDARVDADSDAESDSDADVTDRTSGQWQVAAVMTAFGLLPTGMPDSPTDLAHLTPGSSTSSALPVPIPISVQVVMDLPTALGLADNPAMIPGYGVIDGDLAQQLACDGEWRRWVTDPIDGHLLDDGDRRFPGARLRRFLKARDPRCDMPPCGRVARTDADHTPAFRDSGSTSAATMSTACITHNRSRDAAGWTAHGDGRWCSPLGRLYRTQRHQPLPVFAASDLATTDSDPPPF